MNPTFWQTKNRGKVKVNMKKNKPAMLFMIISCLNINQTNADSKSDYSECENKLHYSYCKSGDRSCDRAYLDAKALCVKDFRAQNEQEGSAAGSGHKITGPQLFTKIPDQLGRFPFLGNLAIYCLQYEAMEPNEVNQSIRDLRASTPYLLDDYFRAAGCKPQIVGGVNVPVLHLTAEAPCSRAEFPKIINKYYTKRLHQPEIWNEIVNALNTDGETYLDFIEHVAQKNA